MLGDFRKAQETLKELEAKDFFKRLQRLRLQDPLRIRLLACAAELHFYQGNNETARNLLKEYANQIEDVVSRKEVTPREKLQLAEFFYSQGDFRRALVVAEQILDQSRQDLWGFGETCYFLSRCYSRLRQQKEREDFSGKALDYFLQMEGEPRIAVQWQIGRAYLLEGFSLWRDGHPDRAMVKLHTARSLLTRTGDFISIANVEQSLGCILRSFGRLEEAIGSFASALDHYQEAGHQLNIARVLTNLGRTWLDKGNWNNAD